MVDKEIIAQRKRVYGDNFKDIINNWNEYLNTELEPKDAAMMMALMKETRINSIKSKLKGLDLLSEEANELLKGLKDSQKDKANYLWIATNWNEYAAIGNEDIGNFQIRFKKNPNAQ